MRTILLATSLLIILSSCGKEGGGTSSGDHSQGQSTQISAKDKNCLDNYYLSKRPSTLADIAEYSYSVQSICNIHQQKIISYIKDLRGIQNDI